MKTHQKVSRYVQVGILENGNVVRTAVKFMQGQFDAKECIVTDDGVPLEKAVDKIKEWNRIAQLQEKQNKARMFPKWVYTL